MKNLRYKLAVVKVGSSILTNSSTKLLDRTKIKNLASDISEIIDSNVKIILVTSGAIASGMGILKIEKRPTSLVKLQACASLGQVHLMDIYNEAFKACGKLSAQVLLTKDDFTNRARYFNAKSTIEELINCKVVPIINENDAISNEEIKFGDNDMLSSLVANLVHADALIILTDVEGLHQRDEKGSFKKDIISTVTEITKDIEEMSVGGSLGSNTSIGGMSSKIEAAKVVTKSGICCIIASGQRKRALLEIFEGGNIGTTFLPSKERLSSRKRWLAYSSKPSGSIKVDKGAGECLAKHNKSLLSAGIISVAGNFEKGDVVNILDENGKAFARGISNYSSVNLDKIKGKKTGEIKAILGYKSEDEAVHRDNLVVL